MAAIAENPDLPLFPSSAAFRPSPLDAARRSLERDFAKGKALERRAALDPRFSDVDRRRLTALARELRGLRDCYDAARHPRVRQALLDEAARVTRRMCSLGSRLAPGAASRRG